MKLYCSQTDEVIAGVLGGIANNLGWDSHRLRVVWVIATICTAFAGLLVYLALWYLMPEEPPPEKSGLIQPWKVSLPSK